MTPNVCCLRLSPLCFMPSLTPMNISSVSPTANRVLQDPAAMQVRVKGASCCMCP